MRRYPLTLQSLLRSTWLRVAILTALGAVSFGCTGRSSEPVAEKPLTSVDQRAGLELTVVLEPPMSPQDDGRVSFELKNTSTQTISFTRPAGFEFDARVVDQDGRQVWDSYSADLREGAAPGVVPTLPASPPPITVSLEPGEVRTDSLEFAIGASGSMTMWVQAGGGEYPVASAPLEFLVPAD